MRDKDRETEPVWDLLQPLQQREPDLVEKLLLVMEATATGEFDLEDVSRLFDKLWQWDSWRALAAKRAGTAQAPHPAEREPVGDVADRMQDYATIDQVFLRMRRPGADLPAETGSDVFWAGKLQSQSAHLARLLSGPTTRDVVQRALGLLLVRLFDVARTSRFSLGEVLYAAREALIRADMDKERMQAGDKPQAAEVLAETIAAGTPVEPGTTFRSWQETAAPPLAPSGRGIYELRSGAFVKVQPRISTNGWPWESVSEVGFFKPDGSGPADSGGGDIVRLASLGPESPGVYEDRNGTCWGVVRDGKRWRSGSHWWDEWGRNEGREAPYDPWHLVRRVPAADVDPGIAVPGAVLLKLLDVAMELAQARATLPTREEFEVLSASAALLDVKLPADWYRHARDLGWVKAAE